MEQSSKPTCSETLEIPPFEEEYVESMLQYLKNHPLLTVINNKTMNTDHYCQRLLETALERKR